jgi:hypothetical protein
MLPHKNRRRFLTVLLVAMSVFVVWTMLPASVDQRFVGTWSINARSDSIRFEENGHGTYVNGAAFEWWVNNSTLHINLDPGSLRDSIRKIELLVSGRQWHNTFNIAGTKYGIISLRCQNGDPLTLTRNDAVAEEN